jgi:putative aminopeptidase FrvX
MLKAARRAKIPHQLLPSGELAGNDSKYIQTSDSAVATVDIGIPNRNMHTQAEICSLDDVENAVKLLVGFLTQLDDQSSLAPFDL